MPEQDIPAANLFSAEPKSLATLPHLITALDSPLLNALVRINGSKPGIWNVSPPYDENDTYVPHRDEFEFSEWSLGYNQNELLKAEVFEPGVILVDSGVKTDTLRALEENRPENGYQDVADFPALLKQVGGWALIPMRDTRAGEDTPAERVLFVATEAKKDFVGLLKDWCHQNGRSYFTLGAKGDDLILVPRHAPEDARQKAVWHHGHLFLQKMALQGFSPAQVKAHMDTLFSEIGNS